MIPVIRKWYEARFHDEEAIVLALLLVVGCLLVVFFSEILTPVIAALVVAFLFQGVVGHLTRVGCPHWLSVLLAFLMIVVVEVAFIVVMFTLVLTQFDNFVNELPKMVALAQETLANLQVRYPTLVTTERAEDWTQLLQEALTNFGQAAVTFSQSNISNLISFFVYLLVVPVFVFFFLKDKDQILSWFARWLPEKRPLLNFVWQDMNQQMANYIRGKFIEMLIVGGVSYTTFAVFGLNYAALLGFLVGISVIVPYVGAFLVTIPVAFVAYLQWGITAPFVGVSIAYLVIQILDGNVLVPILFSEAVNLHPVAILFAILFFGGIWGLWGVFFAIPLATLIKSVLGAWPNPQEVTWN